MSASVRISLQAARCIRTLLGEAGIRTGEWVAALNSAIASAERHSSTKAARKSSVKAKKAGKRDGTAEIWEACWTRSADPVTGYHVCECGCGRAVIRETTDLNAKAELDHVFSKGKGARLPQSVETCWILRADCHRERTNNRPDTATWWRKFSAHLQRNGLEYTVAASMAFKRLRFVETRSMLGAGLKERGT